jgi:hypothetical protein
MKFLSLLALAVMLLDARAQGGGMPPQEMIPGKKGFEIAAERLPTGNIRFTSSFKSRSGNFEDYRLSLSVVQVHLTDTEWNWSTKGLRRLPGEQRGQSIVCVFDVTPQELATPNVSFTIVKSNKGDGLSTPLTWFVPLAKLLPTQPALLCPDLYFDIARDREKHTLTLFLDCGHAPWDHGLEFYFVNGKYLKRFISYTEEERTDARKTVEELYHGK